MMPVLLLVVLPNGTVLLFVLVVEPERHPVPPDVRVCPRCGARCDCPAVGCVSADCPLHDDPAGCNSLTCNPRQ